MRKLIAVLVACSGLSGSLAAHAAPSLRPAQDIEDVAPQLQGYTEKLLFGDVWKRPELSPRDRSLITMSALVAGGHTAQMPGHFNRALDNGVKPVEITALITHLAFYSGWPNAISAMGVAKKVFKQRGIRTEQFRLTSRNQLPVDEVKEAERKAAVDKTIAPVAPALRPLHRRRFVRRPLAAAGFDATGSKCRHCGGADCRRAGRPMAIPPEPCNG